MLILSYQGKSNQAQNRVAQIFARKLGSRNLREVWVGDNKMADEDGEVEENIDGLSHPEVMSLFSKKLAEIMSDPLLIGLPNEPTLDEVNSQIALEHGRAIVVNVRQQDEMNTVLRKELFTQLESE